MDLKMLSNQKTSLYIRVIQKVCPEEESEFAQIEDIISEGVKGVLM